MKKSFVVLGSGLMGKVAAESFISQEKEASVTLIDNDDERLKDVANAVKSDRLTVRNIDITDTDDLQNTIAGQDVILNALPLRLSLQGIEAAIRAKVPLVDLSGERPEKRVELDERVRTAGIIVIPGCGVAPGISNICVGEGAGLLDSVENAIIYVGGIPKKKGPPLDYKTVYSLESVLYYYSQSARIFRDGKEIEVAALSGIEEVEFDQPFGNLEAFYTDGLASLIITMKGKVSGNLEEKTLRYAGHAEKILFLKQCGLFDTSPVAIHGADVSPRDFLVHQLSPLLELDSAGDILVMRIVVNGSKEGKEQTHTFEVIDYFDPKTNNTAMARTTVFPAVIAARMIANGDITDRGVRFPEQVITGEKFKTFAAGLEKQGIALKHSVV